MAIQPTVFVPALAVAHLLGIIILVYSLEKVFGVVSKTRRRLRSRVHRDDHIDLEESEHAERGSRPTAEELNVDFSEQFDLMCSSKFFQGGIAVQSQPVGRLTDAWIRRCSCRQVWPLSEGVAKNFRTCCILDVLRQQPIGSVAAMSCAGRTRRSCALKSSLIVRSL